MLDEKKLSQPITVNDRDSHNLELTKKILTIQFEYIDQIAKEKGVIFFDALKENFELEGFFCHALESRLNIKEKKEQKERMGECAEHIKKLCQDEEGEYVEKVVDYIDSTFRKWGPEQKNEEIENPYGLVSASVHKGFGENAEFDKELRKKYNISDQDASIELHIESYYKSEDSKQGDPANSLMRKIKDSFSQIAIDIVEKNNHVKAVHGISWLLGNKKIAEKKLGFDTYDPRNKFFSATTWNQFIDHNGQINQKRLKQLIENKKPPLDVKVGIIPVEKFLKLYLPKELKEKEIVLRDINPEWQKERIEINTRFKVFLEDWKDLDAEEIEPRVDSDEVLSEFLEEIGLKDRLISVFIQIKKEGLELKESSDERLESLSDTMSKEADKNKYIERTIKL